jgi:hypothetical protein
MLLRHTQRSERRNLYYLFDSWLRMFYWDYWPIWYKIESTYRAHCPPLPP